MSEKDKVDKSKMTKSLPKDAQVVMSILKELRVTDYEPCAINQLLEFTYRYVTCLLDDAKVLANHARKKTIELEDVKLALDELLDKSFTQPPTRQVLAKLADVRNSMPLPPVKPHCGLRLPPDRYCLTAVNYKLRATNPPKKMTKSALGERSTLKSQMKVGPHTNTTIKRQSVVQPKSQNISIPKPIIKFSTTPKSTIVDSKSQLADNNVNIMQSGNEDEVKKEDINEDMDFEEVP